MAPDPAAEGAAAHRPIPDDLLARRATKGDRRAFEAIYRRYHRDLYRFCLAMVGNAQDAQDALQNTMVKVLRALPGEQRQIQLRPWLYRIARNEAIETVRRRRDSVELEPEHGSTGIELAETAEHRERLRRLIADLEELPERQRAVLVMRELAGLGFEQIGETFETSPAVARQTVYEARLSLRQMEEGREMACDQVMRELSDADGRVTRRRELRAHLRGCASCRAFGESIGTRRGEFAAIAPLPAALSTAMLHGILSGKASAAGLGGSAAGGGGAAAAASGAAAGSGAGAGAGAGGLAGTIGAGAGKAIATSAILKAAATVAVVATVGVTAADRGGLIDVPLLGGSAKSSQSSSSPPAQGAAGSAKDLEAENKTAGEGRRAAGSSRAASAAAAQRSRSGATPAAGARRAGSDHRASADAHANGRGASHRHEGLPATANHGQSSAAPHKAATRGASGSAASHASRHPSRKSHRRSPSRHSSHHAVHRAPPPKPAPPREAPTATTPTPPPAPSEPAATGASATGPTTGTE